MDAALKMDPRGIHLRILMINGPSFCWRSCNCRMFTVWFVPWDALKKVPSYRGRNPRVPVSGAWLTREHMAPDAPLEEDILPEVEMLRAMFYWGNLGSSICVGMTVTHTHTTLMSVPVSAGKSRKFIKGLRSSGQLSRLGLQTEQIFVQSSICGTCWTNSQRRSGQNVFFLWLVFVPVPVMGTHTQWRF